MPLCSYVTLSPKLMSLNNMSFCLNLMLPSPYVRMLLCLQNLCHWKICLYVLLSKPYVTIPLCSFVTLSWSPMFLCLTQKPHPVRLGWGCVPRKRENQINTLVLKDINFTINIIDCLITERLIPWINLINAPVVKASPSRRRGCP